MAEEIPAGLPQKSPEELKAAGEKKESERVPKKAGFGVPVWTEAERQAELERRKKDPEWLHEQP